MGDLEELEKDIENEIDMTDEGDVDTLETGFSLELGDVIEIISPTNSQFHEQTFYITYISPVRIEMINVSTFQVEKLTLDETQSITDESITEINLLSRSEEKGFARQKGLLPTKWIDIHFGGDIPAVVTGEITNLEEDEIEITTFPEKEVIFINFEYQGLPEDIPIDKIVIRDPPRGAFTEPLSKADIGTSEEREVMEEASITYTETGESIIDIPDNVSPDENIREVLHSIYLNANELFGEDLEEIFQAVEVPEREKKYGLDIQVNDLTDELLSTIPNSKRTKIVMNKIHTLVARFKELRNAYSTFDTNGNITGKKLHGDLYKPIIERLLSLDTRFRWIIPVVEQRKKIYDVTGNGLDFISLKYDNDITDQSTIYENYYKNNVQGDELKYVHQYSRTNGMMTPFDAPIDFSEFLLFNQNIKADLEAIVNNLGDFYSTVKETGSKDTNMSRFKYLVQRYNLGSSYLENKEISKTGHKIFIRKPIAPNDKITIKSLILMPEQVMKYSCVDLPGTNILLRSQLSQHNIDMFRIFNKKLNIRQKIVDDLTTEFDYENEKGVSGIGFLKDIVEFMVDDTIEDEQDKYQKFLNVIFPKIRVLIRIMQKYMNDKLSFVDVVKILEPFMIYGDNISYGQYNEIRYIIKQKIIDYKKELLAKRDIYAEYRNHVYRNVFHPNEVKRLYLGALNTAKLHMYPQYRELYLNKHIYQDTTQHIVSGEELSRVLSIDNGDLLANLIRGKVLHLLTPDKLFDVQDKADLKTMDDNEKVGDRNCVRRFLTKTYHSIAEMQKDNGPDDIYYDKELDDTPYSILKKYEDERKKLLPEKFVDFLAENLVQKHECPRSLSKEMAQTIIKGKKKVQNGEYAIVELKPSLPKGFDKSTMSDKEEKELEIEEDARTRYLYYKRLNDHWVKDDDIKDEDFMDNNALFCNMDFKCYKNQTAKTCDPIETNEMRMKKLATKRAMDELEKRIIKTTEEMKEEITQAIMENIHHIQRNTVLLENSLTKPDFIAYELGKYANNDDVLTSPYAKLFLLIQGQDDFSKKQQDICRFVEKFTREPLADQQEDMHWLYCIETNTKLVPVSLSELASTFVTGGDYRMKLLELYRTVGELSDDGSSWTDKYCGCELQKIDYVAEEEYDESGFKILSNSILEKDLGTVAAETLTKAEQKKQKIFEDETSEMVYNIYMTICNNLDLPMDNSSIEEFVLRISMEMVTNKDILLSEKSYTKRAEKIEKEKGKAQLPYKMYKHQTIITIVSSVLFVAIQTVIPSFKVRKTFPGCVRSFSGFPMDGGIEDTSGIKYMACVVDKSKSSIEPWNSIQKLTSAMMEKRIKEVIEKFVITRQEISEMYLKKREYNLLHPDEIPPDELRISKWKHFLPPIVDISIAKSLKGTSSDYDSETVSLIQKGHKDQHEHINMYKSKIIQHTFAIVETINDIVKSKEVLLKTMAKIPFLENACCNELENSTNPMSYFISEDKNIDLYIKRSIKYGKIVRNTKRLAIADMLFHKENTALKYPAVPLDNSEKNIYHAFIHYCNFDSDVPIPDDLKTICLEKPDGYDRTKPLEEKIEFLKKAGKRYTIDDLHILMKAVNRRNEVDIIPERDILPVNMLSDLLESFDKKSSTIVEEPLRKLLNDVLQEYDPRIMIDVNDKTLTPFNKAISRLRNYLTKTNEKMHQKIMSFIDTYGNLNTSKFNGIQEYILNLMSWELDKEQSREMNNYSDAGLFTVTNFIKNTVYYMTRVFPNMIINNVTDTTVHKHWGLDPLHMKDITEMIEKHLAGLTEFKQNHVIQTVLENMYSWVVDLNLFMSHIPIRTQIQKNGHTFYGLFDKRTLYLLFSYCWYSAVYEYVNATDDPDMLMLDVKESKRKRRTDIENAADRSNDIGTMHSQQSDILAEYEDELMDVEILSGEKADLKKNICSLLLAYLDIEIKSKKNLDIPYSKINRRVNRSKEQEKKSITDFFKEMHKDERGIEMMLKKYKMGRWDLGNQKGIFQYDADMYKTNRDANLARLYNDMEQNELEEVQLQSLGVEDLDALDEIENIDTYDAEGNDISGLGEDYTDGVYYQEDQDNDFGYD